jgi:hypothetical protein
MSFKGVERNILGVIGGTIPSFTRTDRGKPQKYPK